MAGSLAALPVGERAPVQVDGVGVPAGGQVGGGELVPRAERIGVLGAVDPLGIGERLLQDGDRPVKLAAPPRGRGRSGSRASDHFLVIRPRAARSGYQASRWNEPTASSARPAASWPRPAAARPGRSAGARRREPVAGRCQVTPVVRGRPGQASVIQAVARPVAAPDGSHRPTAGLRRLLEGRGAGPQTGSGPAERFRCGPGLQQRVRGDPGRLIKHGFRYRVAQRRLQHRAHPHRRRRRRPLDRQQADAFERRQRGAGPASPASPVSPPVR